MNIPDIPPEAFWSAVAAVVLGAVSWCYGVYNKLSEIVVVLTKHGIKSEEHDKSLEDHEKKLEEHARRLTSHDLQLASLQRKE